MTEPIARATGPRGDLTLRRRPDRVVELRVNGVFVMDTGETASERLLGSASLAAVRADLGPTAPLRVLIGGLGLGYTLAEVLRDPHVRQVTVVEIEADLVGWHRHGLVDVNTDALADPRTSVSVEDVRTAIAQSPDCHFDLILLDVDNGPGYLVHDANGDLYGRDMLTACHRACRPGGAVAVWSATAAPELAERMAAAFGSVRAIEVPVELGRRVDSYWLYLARSDRTGISSSGT